MNLLVESPPSARSNLFDKQTRLFEFLSALRRTAVCFSGGISSLYLLWSARKVIGKAHVLALTATGPNFSVDRRRRIAALTASLDVVHRWIKVSESRDSVSLDLDLSGSFDRKEFFSKISTLSQLNSMTITDGLTAARKMPMRPNGSRSFNGIRHPLKEAGLTQQDILSLTKIENLPISELEDTPFVLPLWSQANETQMDSLQLVHAKAFLKKLGFQSCQARPFNQDSVSLEVGPKEHYLAVALAPIIKAYFKGLGFQKICLSL